MIDITEQTEKCFAMVSDTCTALCVTQCTGCKFYKPKGCKDWVRIEDGDKTYIMPMEDFKEGNYGKV